MQNTARSRYQQMYLLISLHLIKYLQGFMKALLSLARHKICHKTRQFVIQSRQDKKRCKMCLYVVAVSVF